MGHTHSARLLKMYRVYYCIHSDGFNNKCDVMVASWKLYAPGFNIKIKMKVCLHSDVWRPSPVSSMSGFRYFFYWWQITHDWIYLMKQKKLLVTLRSCMHMWITCLDHSENICGGYSPMIFRLSARYSTSERMSIYTGSSRKEKHAPKLNPSCFKCMYLSTYGMKQLWLQHISSTELLHVMPYWARFHGRFWMGVQILCVQNHSEITYLPRLMYVSS